jgi:DNA excision repair protein ERCC-4
VIPLKTRKQSVVVWPFTLAVDTREQAPFSFQGFEARENDQRVPLVIPTQLTSLQTGDYSVSGFESRVAVERKSLEDLYGTLGGGRERFERELERLQEMDFAAVVVESTWSRVMEGIEGRRITPEAILSSVFSYQQRFRGVHWWMCQNRRDAETATFRILRRFAEGSSS